jgi:hypothetical protein
MAPTNSDALPRNIVLDRRTVTAMVRLYCGQQHRPARGTLCAACGSLLEYASARLEKCPFSDEKTTCRECPVHCYRPVERDLMKTVMRYSGPRMLWRHPLLAVRHLWLDRQGPPPWPPRKARAKA